MEPHERGRKQIETRAAQRESKARRLAAGQLKGSPVAESDRPDRVKAPARAAGRDLTSHDKTRPSPQLTRPDPPRSVEQQSLRLRLRVEGESISVLDADIVDAPGTLPEEVRGTHFLEVRLGDRILAAQPLRDPGIAVGIPNRSDHKAMRGHRFIELDRYEVVVRVPLGPLETIVAERLQGSPAPRRSGPRLEVAIFEAHTSLALDPRRPGSLQAQRRNELVSVARSKPLPIDELYGSGGRQRKRTDD